jgi:hypothetical protein
MYPTHPLFNRYQGIFPERKSIVEVKNAWSYIPTASLSVMA